MNCDVWIDVQFIYIYAMAWRRRRGVTVLYTVEVSQFPYMYNNKRLLDTKSFWHRFLSLRRTFSMFFFLSPQIIETEILPEIAVYNAEVYAETVQASHRDFSCSNGLFPIGVVGYSKGIGDEDGRNDDDGGGSGCGFQINWRKSFRR